jgi:uncharacterized damage-inducible protein DinB
MALQAEHLSLRTGQVRGAGVAALLRLLDGLADTVITMDPEVYCARLESRVSGSIGEHVRHCLDHVAALISADPTAQLSYDRRERGTTAETNPGVAIHQILQLKTALGLWSTRSMDEPIRIRSQVSSAGDSVTSWSTLGRELAFVLSHTIHHQAVIALLLTTHGVAVPERFGYAPSTPQRH